VPLQDPVIDDRRYEDILGEIRTRIARYTPEWRPVWSDVNDSDPGITLAQVFAWLADMLLYRMGRVPELNYVKFLQLIGEELRPAQAASAEITFTVDDASPRPYVDVPPFTQVSASVEGPPVVFETERPLRAAGCRLLSLQGYDGAQYSDFTTANEEAREGFLPFGELPRQDAALTLGLGFQSGYADKEVFPPGVLSLTFWAAEPDGEAARVRTCGPASTRAYAPARLRWEGWDGVRWQALDTVRDDTLAFTQTGRAEVRVTAAARLKRAHLGAYDAIDPLSGAARDPLFWLRACLVQNQYERPPRLLAVRPNTVPALQAQTVLGEILGGANGSRNQTFQLANAPVIPGSVTVEIDDGTGPQRWEVKDDLYASGPRDAHLAINHASGELRAGDGENGAIPVANPANPDANVVAVSYRYGGGKRGNVPARSIVNLLTPVADIDAGRTENLFAAAGGREEELLEEAKKRAPRSLRARGRAVTTDDFRLLAEEAGNVKRALALPLTHPQFPGVKVPGAVTVIVVPDSPAPAPTPSDGLLRTVCEYLDARRLLTTEVFVVAPRYVTVSARVQVVARDDSDPGDVKVAVETALTDYFHPLHGGDDGQGWPFGGALRYSKIVQRVFAARGVDSVPQLSLVVDEEPRPPCTDVLLERIAPHALLTSTGHVVEVLTADQLEATA
jgi:predicted phage baseplate assembly protein